MTTNASYRTGPFTFQLADGEIRYIRWNGNEIIRRIYFTARYGAWNVARSECTDFEVQERDGELTGSFRVRFSGPQLDYEARVRLTVSASHGVNFHVAGRALVDSSDVRRCGLCVLLGAPEYVGATFAATGGSGRSGTLGKEVSSVVLPASFSAVSVHQSGWPDVDIEYTGAEFGLEDQRAFNDSSWKLFSDLDHPYPDLAAGEVSEASVTVRVLGDGHTQGRPQETEPGSGVMPRILIAPAPSSTQFFANVRPADAAPIWGFTPVVNLWDDDTIVENIDALGAQLDTATALGGAARFLRLDPVSLRSPDGEEPWPARTGTPIAAAYALAVIRQMALHSGDEAVFDLGCGPVARVLQVLASRVGCHVRDLEVRTTSGQRSIGISIEPDSAQPEYWAASLSSATEELRIANVAGKFNVATTYDASGLEHRLHSEARGGSAFFDCRPYAVIRLS